jgi:hypothetical protein
MFAAVCRRRRKALVVGVLVLSCCLVLAHGAAAADHMGDAAMICLAVADTAALGALALAAPSIVGDVRRPSALRTAWRHYQRARRQARPPWPRGSPVALQVLRL